MSSSPSITNTTRGDSSNEVAISYKTRGGAHNIRALNQVSPGLLLVHLSKRTLFNIVTNNDEELAPISRGVKMLMLRDISL